MKAHPCLPRKTAVEGVERPKAAASCQVDVHSGIMQTQNMSPAPRGAAAGRAAEKGQINSRRALDTKWNCGHGGQ